MNIDYHNTSWRELFTVAMVEALRRGLPPLERGER